MSFCCAGNDDHGLLLMESFPSCRCSPPTSLVCLELTFIFMAPSMVNTVHNNQMNIHTGIKLIKIFISVGNDEVS